MKHLLSLLLLITSIALAEAQNKPVIFSGYVKESGSGENLIGATVFFPALKVGISTNAYGFYSVSVPAGTDSLLMTVSIIGYKSIQQKVLPDKNQTMTISLSSNALLKEVVVDATAIRESKTTQMSTIDLSAQEIKNVPALFGEKDVIKTLQLLPGVQKGSEGSSGLYVRGGGPDQNLIILDDAPVYNANHLFGFFSTFNGDAIKNVQLVKGGFPAQYGGRLSSVVDISLKDGDKEHIHGEVGIGLIASRAVLEGPIKKGKSSFIISGRRTYVDVFTALVTPKGVSAGYYFYDLNAKLNFELSAKDRLYISGYFGQDKFYAGFKEDSSKNTAKLYWGNATGTLRWNHKFSDKLFSNLSAITTDYTFGVLNESEFNNEKFRLSYTSQIHDYTLKNDFDWYLNNKHQVKIGAIGTLHRFTPEALVVQISFADQNINRKNIFYGFESGVYVSDDWKVNDRLGINMGARLSSFVAKGKAYMRPEPRISGRYSIRETLSVKASYAEMNQYLHLLSNSTPGLPTDLWVPATKKVVPQFSRQLAAGITKDFPESGFSASYEMYYKWMNNILAYKEGASFFEDDPSEAEGSGIQSFEDKVTQGKGRSYGGEFFVKYNKKKFNGWIGYTLSWTKQQFDDLNFGREYYAKYDRRHDISVVGSYQISPRRRLSLTWVYGSGNAITLEQGTASLEEPFVLSTNTSFYSSGNSIIYGEKNGFRMRAYHRLDIGLQTTKKKKWGLQTTEISIYNAYNRANPFFYYIGDKTVNGQSTGESVVRQITLFPIIPAISYCIKF